jgi:hypothetical protein
MRTRERQSLVCVSGWRFTLMRGIVREIGELNSRYVACKSPISY